MTRRNKVSDPYLITVISEHPALFDNKSSATAKAAAWKSVALKCGNKEELLEQQWTSILAAHKTELAARAQESTTGSGSKPRKSLCPHFDSLHFLREGEPTRRTISNVGRLFSPFEQQVPKLPSSPPPAKRRSRTPSENLNDKLEECLQSVNTALQQPTSSDYALGVTLGRKLDSLPDGALKFTWRANLTTALTNMERDILKLKQRKK